ncbi:tyrosine-type recombinase/integrase [Roseofilum capinflatum]|uniref:Tyrosine-type recombinase/integrase n=1 Tax=Roseofilum capinflatum BLCC-M114 TaxID=3022440 RepID=A0ABT7B166_9CYAN|nr:tyrosine-type recombinase/integrase [Roseofilum capinflatum]MDJ1172908.1 tyrosine-type recombinase/integrase [Roseofilum capinflatum BLCC-M114]
MSITQSVIGQIKRDIHLGKFDPSLQAYSQNHIDNENRMVTFLEESLQWGLDDVWEFYKDIKRNDAPLTTQKNHWAMVDNAIGRLSPSELISHSAKGLVTALLLYYGGATLERLLNNIIAASNLAYEHGKIAESYWGKVKKQLPSRKQQKRDSNRTQKAYSVDEVAAILEALKSDKYCPHKSAYSHSNYYRFVEFLVLTGCRPGEAIALTWGDIEGGKIRFNKSYSLGVLKGTKNGKTRYFPINDRLNDCLMDALMGLNLVPMVNGYFLPVAADIDEGVTNCKNALKPDLLSCLVFSSITGGYINLQNFTNRVFKRVIDGLYNDGLIKQKLPTYNLRNTSASFYLRMGVDRATIAHLFETSGEMLDRHYFSPDASVELPEM